MIEAMGTISALVEDRQPRFNGKGNHLERMMSSSNAVARSRSATLSPIAWKPGTQVERRNGRRARRPASDVHTPDDSFQSSYRTKCSKIPQTKRDHSFVTVAFALLRRNMGFCFPMIIENGFRKFAHHNISLQQLWHVVVAADLGSFRQASEICSIKQSTLSRSVRQLESLIKAPLFERSSRGVHPTTYGQIFLAFARNTLEQIEAVSVTSEMIGRGQSGRISIGFYTSLSTGNLRAALIEFAKGFPKVDIGMTEGSRATLATALRNGIIDVAIMTGDYPLAGLQSISLWSERILVVVPEAHRLAKTETVYWTDLSGETLLLDRGDPGLAIQEHLAAKLVSPEERPKIIWHDASHESVRSLVGAGFGIGLTLEASLGASFDGIVHRKISDGTDCSRISLSANWREDNRNPVAGQFLNVLKRRPGSSI